MQQQQQRLKRKSYSHCGWSRRWKGWCCKGGTQTEGVKPKPETVIDISLDTEEQESNEKSVKQRSSKNGSSRKVRTLTSILTARSKAACGLTEKEQIHNIDAADAEDQLAVMDYVEDIYKFYRLAEKLSTLHSTLLIDTFQ